MRGRFADVSITTVVALAFLATILFTPTADAKRRTGDDQSEGGETTNYVFMAAGLAVIAGVTVYIVTKGKEETQEGEPDQEAEESENAGIRVPTRGAFASLQERVSDPIPAEKPLLSPFVGLGEQMTITVGVSLSF